MKKIKNGGLRMN